MGSKEKNIFKVDDRLRSVAIIMDGNGRWAKKRLMPRTLGHKAGAAIIEKTLLTLKEMGVRYVTLYAFSTENWKRPKEEVDALMELIYRYLDEQVTKTLASDNDLCVKFIGDKSALSERLRNKCIEVEKMAENRPFVCNVALNYGGRDEIVMAANRAIEDGHTKLTEEILSKYMYTSSSPDPDLIIRTGGDLRVSNFLIWQGAYSELYVTDTLWPDFNRECIIEAIREFYKRKRRFGGLDPEDSAKAILKEEKNEG